MGSTAGQTHIGSDVYASPTDSTSFGRLPASYLRASTHLLEISVEEERNAMQIPCRGTVSVVSNWDRCGVSR